MNSVKKAGSLIVSNIGMFSEAYNLVEEIHCLIFEKIDEKIEEWAISNGWSGIFKFDDDKNCIYPPDFSTGEKDGYFAAFQFSKKGESDSLWLADLCNQGQTSMGFQFVAEANLFGGKQKWNAYSKNLSNSVRELPKYGFLEEGKGSWFLPVQVNKDALAKAYENDDYDVVFEPITDALDKIKSCISIFVEVVDAGKKSCLGV